MYNITESIERLNEEIIEKQNQIELLKNLDLSAVPTEKEWHEICETPLRNSEILCDLVKNIFPNATEINWGCNYVYFKLNDFKIQIPTSRCQGIEINLDWFYDYRNNKIKKEDYYSSTDKRVKRYFEALDNKADWYTLAKLRLRNRQNKLLLFIKWFGYYKWEAIDRLKWEVEFEKRDIAYCKAVDRNNQNIKEIDKKVKIVVEEIVPMLKKYSDCVWGVCNGCCLTDKYKAMFRYYDRYLKEN